MAQKDVLLAKISIVKNCLKSIEKATQLDPDCLDDRFVQDVFVLNLERSIQACIDIANVIISEKGFSLPSSYRHSFQVLESEKVISLELSSKMQKMVGFRNIAVHDYQQLDLAILKSILKSNLEDLEEFCRSTSTSLD